MLGKLVKDEFKSYRFSFGIVLLTGVIFTVFMKVLCMIPYEQEAKTVLQMFIILGYFLILALMSVAAQVLIIIRFYTTMVSDRGYLTWTLPVSSATHIWAKLIGGILWKLVLTAAVVLLVVIFFSGSYWSWMDELGGLYNSAGGISLGWVIREAIKDVGANIEWMDVVRMGLELVSGFVGSVAVLLLVYMCIAVGQLFGRWRALASVGCYFLIVIVLQIFSTVFIALLSVNGVSDWVDDFMESIWSDIGSILLGLAVSAGLFAVTNHIFKKHLNLE